MVKTQQSKKKGVKKEAKPEKKTVRERDKLEECALLLASKGKIDKAKRTAEGLKDEAVKKEVLASIEVIAKDVK